MRSSLLAVSTLALAACGSGLHDLSYEAGPLTYVDGRIDLAQLPESARGKPLVAALVWGGVPEFSFACFRYMAEPEVKAACPDPFLFVPGEIASDAPVAADGTFRLPIRRLPSAQVSVGDKNGRIAHGSLFVAVDANGSGAFELMTWAAVTEAPDPVVGASFVSLLEHQERVVFREGAFDAKSFFYPSTGCGEPLVGFSALRGQVQLGEEPPAESCSIEPLSRPIQVSPLTADLAHALECNYTSRVYQARVPETDEWLPNTETTVRRCVDAETLILTDSKAICAETVIYQLKGCVDFADPQCEKPAWDDTAQPPSWWPCTQGTP